MSEEGWLSEDAYGIYIPYVPDAYVRMHIPEPEFFLRMYLRTWSYLQSAGGLWCVSECMCVCVCECVREKARNRKSA